METPSRPQLPRQSSRVPGGFETDEELSPIKTTFSSDDHEPENHNGLQAASTTNAATTLDNSMITSSSEDGGIHLQEDESTLEEREIRRKLMEEDSTFLAPLSPFAGSGRYDTLTSGAALHSFDTPNKSFPDEDTQETIESSSAVYQTPAPGRQSSPEKRASAESADAGYNTSSMDTTSSSPTLKAAARKQPRPTSAASTEGYRTADDEQHASEASDRFAEEDPTPRKETSQKPSDRQRGESPTPTKQESLHDADASSDANVLDTNTSPLRRKRPTFLHTRVSTQKSSFSTYTTTSTEAGSDLTLGADYALQTGGAAPFGSSTSSRPRMDYSRTTSLGSMASGISGISDEDPIKPRPGTLEEMQTVSEENPSITRTEGLREPETPRVASTSTEIPTDTVLARRVNDVEVPVTAAREYRDRHRLPSPDKRGAPTPSVARSGRNLTLKEQSGTIDRLTKENFDLKMKITFLNDSLNKRSPEGVASLVNENADLKASKVTSAKEIRDLKRSIRDLERSLRSKEQDHAEEVRRAREEAEQAASGAQISQEMEEELLFLRDRVVSYDVEIERLRHESLAREREKKRMADILQSRRSGASNVGAREEAVSYCRHQGFPRLV